MLVAARRDATGSREGPSPPEFSANLIVGISPFGLRSGPRAAEGAVVETESLPGEVSLEQLRKQAKDLLRAVRSGDAAAVAEVAGRYGAAGPDFSLSGFSLSGFSLSEAQLVVARRYGFASWSRLHRHAAVIDQYRRDPARVESSDGFLALACLRYEDDDGPERWERARELLASQPGTDIYTAAATADAARLESLLAANPGLATELGGPFRWEPLLYLAYSRVHGADPLASARLLLDAGADPNAGYLWHGLPSPFTVLTGVFGEGELGPVRQPRHPDSLALARLLLEAGADPNDAQALYNRMFGPDDDHLELLLEFGLGTGTGGPWRARLGDAIESPEQLLRGQLRWAITHGMLARVRLLVSHGVDILAPFGDGITPVARALTTGNEDVAAYLVARGAPAARLGPDEEFVAAALAADRDRANADLAGQVRAARPGLIVWAAERGKPGAVELLVSLGFDVNALGRSDAPADDPWQTALHVAAMNGDTGLARRLLALGADTGIRDARFDSTPLGWARYFEQQNMIDLLEPITSDQTETG
jgi:hypothetical protein